MKLTVHRNISPEKLARVLPPAFVDRVSASLRGPVTAVFLPDEVVTGRVAKKALQRIGSDYGASLVFAARDFTLEAQAALVAAGAHVVPSARSCFGWSDERLFDIRVSIATNKKRPLPRKETAPNT